MRHRIVTLWGTHTLVEATRNLLWEAFRDPTNQRFVLISEADVPIWDPLVSLALVGGGVLQPPAKKCTTRMHNARAPC